MGHYIPSTEAQQKQMLSAVGLKDFKDLYKDVPASMYLDRKLDIPEGKSELEVQRSMASIDRYPLRCFDSEPQHPPRWVRDATRCYRRSSI